MQETKKPKWYFIKPTYLIPVKKNDTKKLSNYSIECEDFGKLNFKMYEFVFSSDSDETYIIIDKKNPNLKNKKIVDEFVNDLIDSIDYKNENYKHIYKTKALAFVVENNENEVVIKILHKLIKELEFDILDFVINYFVDNKVYVDFLKINNTKTINKADFLVNKLPIETKNNLVKAIKEIMENNNTNNQIKNKNKPNNYPDI